MPRKFFAESSFWIFLAVLTMTLPLNWLLSAVIAAAVHEMGHLAALHVMSVRVFSFRLRPGGAVLDTAPMKPEEELICALAGPLVSFALFALKRFCPRTAFCAFVQGIFNLIPLGTLDGSRILNCAFCLLSGKSPCKRRKMRVQ